MQLCVGARTKFLICKGARSVSCVLPSSGSNKVRLLPVLAFEYIPLPFLRKSTIQICDKFSVVTYNRCSHHQQAAAWAPLVILRSFYLIPRLCCATPTSCIFYPYMSTAQRKVYLHPQGLPLIEVTFMLFWVNLLLNAVYCCLLGTTLLVVW